MAKRVAVFFGGRSNEHEISVITGMLCVNLLRGAEIDVLPVYLSDENKLYVGEMRSVADFRTFNKKWKEVRLTDGGVETKRGKKLPVDVALNCCHGGFGEDGTLSALLRWHHIKSASPDVALSAVFMDKSLTKIVARGLNIPVVDGVTVHEKEKVDLPFGFPAIVKPCVLGSSIGVTVAMDEKELDEALSLAFTLDSAALIEPYLKDKRDLNCAVYRKDGKVVCSPVEEVFSHEQILSFREKYEGEAAHSRIPADIPPKIAENVQTYAKKLYEGMGGRGVVRADFLLANDEVYFNELNTVPGSLSCYLFADSLSASKDFLVGLLEEGERESIEEKPTLKTGILSSAVFTGKGGKRARF